ncbi:MAG TPA: hydroxyisourate hydrolase [Acidimicrobiia bacterium]
MSGISTHVLDLSTGRPVAGVELRIERRGAGGWDSIGKHVTDADGRAHELTGDHGLTEGEYRLVFATGKVGSGFYPEVSVTFRVDDVHRHYHIPLLISPYGYTTYRGS